MEPKLKLPKQIPHDIEFCEKKDCTIREEGSRHSHGRSIKIVRLKGYAIIDEETKKLGVIDITASVPVEIEVKDGKFKIDGKNFSIPTDDSVNQQPVVTSFIINQGVDFKKPAAFNLDL